MRLIILFCISILVAREHEIGALGKVATARFSIGRST